MLEHVAGVDLHEGAVGEAGQVAGIAHVIHAVAGRWRRRSPSRAHGSQPPMCRRRACVCCIAHAVAPLHDIRAADAKARPCRGLAQLNVGYNAGVKPLATFSMAWTATQDQAAGTPRSEEANRALKDAQWAEQNGPARARRGRVPEGGRPLSRRLRGPQQPGQPAARPAPARGGAGVGPGRARAPARTTRWSTPTWAGPCCGSTGPRRPCPTCAGAAGAARTCTRCANMLARPCWRRGRPDGRRRALPGGRRPLPRRLPAAGDDGQVLPPGPAWGSTPSAACCACGS